MKYKTHKIIVANLYKTLCDNFYLNWQSFIEDMTKTFWLFFWDTV